MKIIDSNGRLFGKINIIDFLVIVFILCLLPMVYFGYKVFSRSSPGIEKVVGPSFNIEMMCKFIGMEPEITALVSVGDAQYDLEGNKIGEVLSVEEIAPHRYEVDIGDEKKIIKDSIVLKQVPVLLRLSTVFYGGIVYYNDVPLSLNVPLEFETDKYNVTMVPMIVPEFKTTEKRYLELYVDLKDLPEDNLMFISEGDKEIDENGNPIAEIMAVGRVANNSFVIDLGGSSFVQVEEAKKKQLAVKMKLLCDIENRDEVYFRGKKLTHNTPIEFNTAEYAVRGIIIPSFKFHGIAERQVAVEVKCKEIMPEIAGIIRVGDMARDLTGSAAGKLKSIVKIVPSEILTLREGEIHFLQHPLYKDITATLHLRCVVKDGTFYFNNQPIKIGNALNFTTDLYNIAGTITAINMDQSPDLINGQQN